ncbi:MAG TPA: anti-sigma factor [Dehalococcoidia bacterium]|nr:anti-sigma factor [Dehalococcoidia bacterium]
MNCEQFEELAGAFALGALPDDEMLAAREHLAACDQPHAEARDFLAVAAGLASAPPEREPSPALKSRLMDTIRAEAGAAPAALAPRPTPERGPTLWQHIAGWFDAGSLGYGLAGALSVLVIALVIWNVSLRDDDTTTDQVVVTLTGASGQITFLPDQNVAIMDVEGLDQPPAGQVYQAWAISGDGPTSIGVVEVHADGSVHQAMVVDEAGVELFAITIEPSPGVDQPTTDPVITAEL